MHKILELKLDNTEYLSIESETTIEEITSCCDYIEIYLRDNENYLIGYDTFHYSVASLIDLLMDAINGKLQLPISTAKDLGYLWNEKCNGFSNELFETRLIEGVPRWIGIDYILFSTPGNSSPILTTWLYNNKNNEIILEITPDYLWHFSDPKPEEKYVTYEDFIRTYRPILIRTIPLDVAKRWVAQAQHLLEFVKDK